MKIVHISHSDSVGGAARAAYRLHRAQLKFGIESRMLVRSKKTDDWTVQGPETRLEKIINMLRPAIGQQLNKLQISQNTNLHSGNWLPSCWANKLNNSDVNIVNLHWVAGETMSIEDIGRIRKPIVWTLHDMWPFCGMEHVTEYGEDARWRRGYHSDNRCDLERGIDLDKWGWLRKKKSWQQPMHIVAPSHWMAECAKRSVLFKDLPISVIPNPLDTEVYKPLDPLFCRRALALPDNRKIILFGAMGGGKDRNKGYDLLLKALDHLSTNINVNDVLCVVFGQSQPENLPKMPFETHWFGHIYDDVTLSLLYNAASVMVVPSRCENLPQTATEAQACGVPVVAFNCTGLSDVIKDKQTGYLAKAYDSQDMAEGLKWILNHTAQAKLLCVNARLSAVNFWAQDKVIEQYRMVYSRKN
ncbi:glycosyltransferase [Aeromonas veronii]|uniref:glycosyltransferase n=1 Tax=Aeromonas veronii TaxID=654 RepID=UPI003D22DC79